MSTAFLRILFAAVFAVTGWLLGREAYTHMISLHVANQVWSIVLTMVVPVAGALAGVFLAPPAQALFEHELNSVESAMQRLGPAEVIGGAVGLVLGLLVAFLAKSVLFEFVANAGPAGAIWPNVFDLAATSSPRIFGRTHRRKQPLPGVPRGDSVCRRRTGRDGEILDMSVIATAVSSSRTERFSRRSARAAPLRAARTPIDRRARSTA